MSDVPSDVVTIILCCLPVKSLLRFKCVSKSWLSIIDSPHFINLHLACSIEKNNLTLYVTSGSTFLPSRNISCIDFASLLDHNAGARAELLDSRPLKYDLIRGGGSSNGLFAMYDKTTESLVVWNPSTGKCYDAPSSKMKLYPSDLKTAKFDAYNNDYKVVMVRRHYSKKYLDVVVYSLEAKCWRKIRTTIDDSSNFYSNSRDISVWRSTFVFFNGAIHWLVSKQGNSSILVFDLRMEEYYELPLPISKHRNHIWRKLLILDGCLCVESLRKHDQGCYFYYELWVMKEHKVKESWVRLLSVPRKHDHCKFHALYYLKNHDKVLVELDYDKILFWYDLKEKSLKRIHINPGIESPTYTICPANLVSIDGDVRIEED